MLEIGRQDVPRRASLFAWVKPKRPVPPEHIFEVGGRIGPDGHELQPLDEAAVRSAARSLEAQDIGSIAVVLLHSYADPAHERHAAAILAEEIPGALVSLSARCCPCSASTARVTTILDATVMPVVSTYVERFDRRIAEQGIEAPLLLMKSSGGVTSTRTVRRAPVETALSGPAAGAVGAAYVGANSGHPNLIGIDIGGTSADISLIHGGEPGLTTNGRIGSWPVGLPMVDMVMIGAGGGSIARLSDTGALMVGPQSAGARPGPVCLRRRRRRADRDGRAISCSAACPPYLLGGSFPLDVEAARAAIQQRVSPIRSVSPGGGRLGRPRHRRRPHGRRRPAVISVERQGADPPRLLAAALRWGGAAARRRAGAAARHVDHRRTASPGGAFGRSATTSPTSRPSSRAPACRRRAPSMPTPWRACSPSRRRRALLARCRGRADEARRVAGLPASLSASGLRAGSCPGRPRGDTEVAAKATVAAFHRLHERLYTFAQEDTPVEIVTLRVDARGVFPSPAMLELPPAGPLEPARTGTQALFLETGPCRSRHLRARAARRRRPHTRPGHPHPARCHHAAAAGPGRHRRSAGQSDRQRGLLTTLRRVLFRVLRQSPSYRDRPTTGRGRPRFSLSVAPL